MIGKSHVTIGVVTYASLWTHPLEPLAVPLFGGVRHPVAAAVALLIVALGSLLPDIDHARSTLARERIVGVPILRPVSWGIGAVFGHRGPTHSLLAFVALLLLGQWPSFPWAYVNLGWLLGWGYVWHLVADALTKSGIPLFWPLPVRFGLPPVRRLRFTTGTWPEAVVVSLIVLGCVVRLVVP